MCAQIMARLTSNIALIKLSISEYLKVKLVVYAECREEQGGEGEKVVGWKRGQ